MVTAAEKYREIKKALAQAGAFDAEFEAREIIKEYSGELPASSAELGSGALSAIDDAVKRRVTGEPLQYIFGKWEFYGYPFYVGKGVLIPRPETELLADIAAQRLDSNSVMLDLFSGTGCVPVSAALKTGAKCYAVELYDDAFAYLEKNIALNGADVTAIKGDACRPDICGDTMFDLITANPPYLTDSEMSDLMREVAFEPETALRGGDDGLDPYRVFIPAWYPRIKPGGAIAAETGEQQGAAVSEIMRACGLSTRVIKDCAGFDRVVIGIK